MALPVLHLQPQARPFDEIVERHETLRMIMEWIADRFADTREEDTSIAWEDGEEHDDELQGPATL